MSFLHLRKPGNSQSKKLRTLKSNTAILRKSVLLLFVWFLLFHAQAQAFAKLSQQQTNYRIALQLDDSNENVPDEEQLGIAHAIGIDLLELSFPSRFSNSALEQFSLFVDTNENFKTLYELKTEKKAIVNALKEQYNSVPEDLKDNIAAFKLLDFPADYDPQFPVETGQLIAQLSNIQKPFYYQSAFSTKDSGNDNLSFVLRKIQTKPDSDTTAISATPAALLFKPSEDTHESLRTFDAILNQSLSNSESLIIIPADWFFGQLDYQPAFQEIIRSYLNGNTVSFPMPANEPEYPPINWPIILLLAIWISFIIHYKYQPVYKATLPRYFNNHSFFVYDVMEHRIRTISSGVVVLLQHAFLTGFFFYLFAKAFISETGLASLSSHLPFLFYPGFEKASLFVVGIILALFSHVISIIWLRLMNKSLRQIRQVINLYSWPLHINLLIITLVVYFVEVDAGTHLLIASACTYFLVWGFSFTIAALDGAKFLERYRVLNLFLTVGLHLLLLTTAIILIFLLPFIFEPLQMAVLLP